MRCHEVDRLDDVLEDGLGDEVVERDARPAGLDALAPATHDLALVLVRALEVDAEQPVAVGAGARAAAAGLDPEQVVEQGDDVVVVQIAPRAPVDDERHDREPVGLEVAEDADVRVLRPALDGAAPEVLLVRVDHVDADGLLELEDETGADRLDDRRSAALLAHDGVVEVAVLGRPDVGDGAATHDVGHAIREQLAPHRRARRACRGRRRACAG